MFGRGGNRPGSGRPKLVRTPLKKVYGRGRKALDRRQARAKYLSIGKELVQCIQRGDTTSDEYRELSIEYNRIQHFLGLTRNRCEGQRDSSDEVRIFKLNFYL